MFVLVKLIGIFIIGMGIVFLLSPEALKKWLGFWKEGNNLYAIAMIRILFGSLLLFVASQCRLIGVLVVLGILMLVRGLIIFVLGLEKTKAILVRWENKPPMVLRLMALLLLGVGTLLLYSL